MYCFLTGNRKKTAYSNDSTSSKISCSSVELIIEKLKANMNRSSTVKNYLSIYRHFNKFLMCLDEKPKFWEERVALFGAYLIEYHKVQSSTLKSYVSAIKQTLQCDGYLWNDDLVYLNVLFRSC